MLAGLAVLVANARLLPLVIDETLGYSLISQPSLSALVHFESTTPIWFDPPAFAMLVHGCWKLFGASALALRLPSIVSILIFLAALYVLLQRIAGRRTAFLITLLAVGSPAFDFGWQQRPYALMMAMVGVAALCWHSATHPPAESMKPRWLPLTGLFLALVLAINSHYFAIFATLPFLLAELVRSVQRRRLDLPVILTLILACASDVLTLPFSHAIMKYSGHVITGDVNWSQVLRTYQLTMPNPIFVWQYIIFGAILIFAVARMMPGSIHTTKSTDCSFWTLVLSLALSPVITVAFAIYVLHAYRERYAIFQCVGVMLLLGILAGPWLNRMTRPAYLTILAVLFAYVILHQAVSNSQIRNYAQRELGKMEPSDNVRAMLLENPDLPVFAPIESCLMESFYGSPLARKHLICVYSADRELLYGKTDTVARTSMVLANQPGFHVVPYETMIATPGPRLLINRREIWENWIEQSLKADGVNLTPLGNGLSGEEFQLSTSH